MVQTGLHCDPDPEGPALTGGYNVWIRIGRNSTDYLSDRLARTPGVIPLRRAYLRRTAMRLPIEP